MGNDSAVRWWRWVGVAAAIFTLVMSVAAFVTSGDRVSRVPVVVEAVPSSAKPRLPPPPADPQMALLGTDSSISGRARQLVLVATEPGRSGRDGRAALGTDRRNPQTYAAGALLANGAVLEEIYSDYVVLSHRGERFVLGLDGKSPEVDAAHLSLSIASDARLVGAGETSTRSLDDVPTSRPDLSEVLRAEPAFERDEFVGLRILPGLDKSALEKLDLQSGDIVRAIDGNRLTSPDDAWQTLDDAISSGTVLIVSVERQGSLLSMTIDGARLGASDAQITHSVLPSAAPES